MVGWHHRLNGHEFEQVLGVGAAQGGLACCSPRGHKKLVMTEQLNNNKSKLRAIVSASLSAQVCMANKDTDAEIQEVCT